MCASGDKGRSMLCMEWCLLLCVKKVKVDGDEDVGNQQVKSILKGWRRRENERECV